VTRARGGARKAPSPLLPIFLIVAVDVLGLTIVIPLLPFYAEHFGATPFLVGCLVTLYAACQLVAGPLLGRISDRVGRKPVLLVSQLGTLIGFIVLARAEALWVVFLSRIIDGVTAGNLSIAQAYIADVSEAKDRTKSFAVIGIAFGLGFLIGPALSGFLSQYGMSVPIWVAAGLSATSIAATSWLLPGGKPPRDAEATAESGRRLGLLHWGEYARYFRNPALASFLTRFFLFCLAFSTFNSGFALFAERRFSWNGVPFGTREVGYVFAYSGFLGLIVQGGLIGRLVKRFGDAKLVALGFVAAAVGYASLSVAETIPGLLAIAAVCTLGTGVLRPTLTSLVSQNVSRNEQGTALGLTQSLNSVAQIVGPLVAGALIDRGWLAAWALAAAASAALGLLLSARVPAAARARIA
jgi:MFS family permease